MNDFVPIRIGANFAIAVTATLMTGAAFGDVYQWDDGSSESSMGLQGGGEIAWMNVFESDPTAHIITSISTCFGSPVFPDAAGVTPGQDFRVHLWGDNDGNPGTGMTYLGSWNSIIEAGAIATDVLQTVLIDPTDVGGFSHFVVGASVSFAAGFGPAPADSSQASLGRSWVAGSSSVWDPSDPSSEGMFELGDLGLSRVWLLRANGIPAPGTLALLALAGATGTRSRRG